MNNPTFTDPDPYCCRITQYTVHYKFAEKIIINPLLHNLFYKESLKQTQIIQFLLFLIYCTVTRTCFWVDQAIFKILQTAKQRQMIIFRLSSLIYQLSPKSRQGILNQKTCWVTCNSQFQQMYKQIIAIATEWIQVRVKVQAKMQSNSLKWYWRHKFNCFPPS